MLVSRSPTHTLLQDLMRIDSRAQVDRRFTGASWLFNWLDADGSVVRQVQPSKPAGPYLIGSYPDWWKLSDTDSWSEPRCVGCVMGVVAWGTGPANNRVAACMAAVLHGTAEHGAPGSQAATAITHRSCMICSV